MAVYHGCHQNGIHTALQHDNKYVSRSRRLNWLEFECGNAERAGKFSRRKIADNRTKNRIFNMKFNFQTTAWLSRIFANVAQVLLCDIEIWLG